MKKLNPKKVFIIADGSYREITPAEHEFRKEADAGYVTDENVVRFCVGVPKDDSSASYAALDAAMDTLIENLKKAA